MAKNILKIFIGVTFVIVLGFAYRQLNSQKNKCSEPSETQTKAYKQDKLLDTQTFDKYKVPVYAGKLSSLNLETSSKEAVMFRTWINAKIEEEGINFAGHYSIVYVGMTGWGQNFFLVDRITGKGIPVSFQIRYLRTQPDSSLLIINPKDLVYADGQNTDCNVTTDGNWGEFYTDLRPYYYNWNGSEFVELGNQAPVNPFWEGYFY